MWFPNRSDTNQAVQGQKTARSMKFRIKDEKGLYYWCSENKGADQLCAYRKYMSMINFLSAELSMKKVL